MSLSQRLRALVSSWRAVHGCERACLFSRLTFTVQTEVADRIAAKPGSGDYGPVSIITALLSEVTRVAAVPPSAFWPQPKVTSQIMRIDFDPAAANRMGDLPALRELLALAFGQRRKQIGSVFRKGGRGLAPPDLANALAAAGVPADARAQHITPEQFAAMARLIAAGPTD